MTSELDFIAALDAEPGNHWLRQVYADFLEDQGDERGPGMRMLAILRRVPDNDEHLPCWLRCWPRTEWTMARHASVLPMSWHVAAGGWDTHPTMHSAFNAAALAWLHLTDAERAKIMAEAGVDRLTLGG